VDHDQGIQTEIRAQVNRVRALSEDGFKVITRWRFGARGATAGRHDESLLRAPRIDLESVPTLGARPRTTDEPATPEKSDHHVVLFDATVEPPHAFGRRFVQECGGEYAGDPASPPFRGHRHGDLASVFGGRHKNCDSDHAAPGASEEPIAAGDQLVYLAKASLVKPAPAPRFPVKTLEVCDQRLAVRC
jgi:hypothetical protein